MTVTITSNKKYYSTQVHLNAAASLVVAGNNSVSNIATSDEVLTGGYIAQAVWGTDAGSIQVRRNGALVSVYSQSGAIDYAGSCLALTVNQASNLDITFVGTSNAYIILEIQKVGPFANSDYFKA